MLFAKFLASEWRWLAYFLAIILAVLLFTQLFDYGQAWRTQRKEAKKVEAIDTARTTRLRTDAAHRSSFDSTVWVQAARARQYAHDTRLKKRHDDSLSNILPAVPVLPQRPARY